MKVTIDRFSWSFCVTPQTKSPRRYASSAALTAKERFVPYLTFRLSRKVSQERSHSGEGLG